MMFKDIFQETEKKNTLFLAYLMIEGAINSCFYTKI